MGLAESKIAFKQSVSKLNADEPLQPEDPIFAQLWSQPESAEDVFSFWAADDLRELTCAAPSTRVGGGESRNRLPVGEQISPKKNLETVIYNAIARLELHQEQDVYPYDHNVKANREIVNCMRILTRVMPYIHQAEHLKEWYNRFFWENQKPTYLRLEGYNRRPDQWFNGLYPSELYEHGNHDTLVGPPLGERLMTIVLRYLFFAGYTLPHRVDDNGSPDRDIVFKVWHSGIGASNSANCTAENFRNQYETVRLLLALTSGTMYFRPDEVATADIKPLTFLTTRFDKRFLNAVCCSLLNTVLRYQPNLWSAPMGYEIVRDSKKLLVLNCLQLLLVTLVYMPPLTALNGGKNVFRQSMGSLFRPDDFQFIHTGIKNVLEQPVSSNRSFISKENAAQWAPESISLLWELVQCNKRFRRYLCDTKISMDYLVILLYYIMDAKDDPTKLGVLRMCVFVLQTFSADAGFAKKMNTPFLYQESLPPIVRINNFHGSYADFFLSSIHDLFKPLNSRLDSVYPALIDIVQNIVPYQLNLQRATCTKLMAIFELLRAPDFFLRNDTNHVMLRGILEACNAILLNHMDENPQFVRVLIKHKHRFVALRELTIEGALAEMERQSLERKERGGDVRSPSRQNSYDSARGPAAVRSPILANVPEHPQVSDNRFAIGEDDDEEEDETNSGERRRSTETSSNAEGPSADTSPARLSERARGKQPAVSLTTAIRNTSSTSLPALIPTTSTSHTFTPSQQWLESYFSRLPLQDIIDRIEEAEHYHRRGSTSGRSSIASRKDADLPDPYTDKFRGEQGGKARQSAQLVRDNENSAETAHPPHSDGQGALKADKDIQPAAGGPVGFQWTSVAVGWYNALLWSRIYLQEGEAFQGSNGLYSSTDIRLFKRHSAREQLSLRNPKGAIDAVGNSLAQRISSIGISKPTMAPPAQ